MNRSQRRSERTMKKQPTRPAWWPTKAQKERADKAHAEAMKRRGQG